MDRYDPNAEPETDPGPPLPTKWAGVAGILIAVILGIAIGAVLLGWN